MASDDFPMTPWSVVVAAAAESPTVAHAALLKLCETYHLAITHWMRLNRVGDDNAADATQDFLVRWLEKGRLSGFVRGEWKFRVFLGACLKNFLTDRARHANRDKRGGEFEHVALDELPLPAKTVDPGTSLDYLLAVRLQNLALQKLKARWDQRLSAVSYLCLSAAAFLPDAPPYADLAAELGTSTNQIKQWIFLIRKEYRELFRKEIFEVVGNYEAAAEEERYFQALLACPPSNIDQSMVDPKENT